MNYIRYTLVACLSLFIHLLSGQMSVDTLVSLDPITVSATRLDASVLRSTRSVYIIDADSLAAVRQNLSLADQLSQVPGIFNLNAYNYAQDLRISMRGFGSRAAFGVRGIKILLDGVPLTTPDGQSQLDHLAPENIARLEVIRGAASGLYGNAAGGLISLKSAPIRNRGGQINLMAGSYGTYRGSVQVNHGKEDWRWQGMASYLAQDGYRDNSATAVFQLQSRFEKDLNKGLLALLVNYTNSPRAEDPGGLNLESVVADRTMARDRNVDFRGGEEVSQLVASASLTKELRKGLQLESRLFLTSRDFSNRLPFENAGQVDLGRLFYGANLQLSSAATSRHRVSVGLDLENQRDVRERFQNEMGVRGALAFDQIEQFLNAGLFALGNFSLSDKWSAETALRLDRIRASVDDRFTPDGDQSGERSYWHVSPSLGVSYRMAPAHTIYTNYGHSFESPTLSELSSNPDGSGGFNADLKALTADHYEIGLRGKARKLNYQLAYFHIDLQNELISFEIEQFPGRTFYRNAASSVRDGIEVSAQIRLSTSFSTNMSYSFSKFRFGDGDADIADKQIPGVPEHNAFWQLTWQEANGWSAALDLRHQGDLFANDENSVTVKAATILDLRAGYQWSKYSVHVGVRNLLGEDYFDNIRINAFGGRYYEAAPLRNLYAGVKVSF